MSTFRHPKQSNFERPSLLSYEINKLNNFNLDHPTTQNNGYEHFPFPGNNMQQTGSIYHQQPFQRKNADSHFGHTTTDGPHSVHHNLPGQHRLDRNMFDHYDPGPGPGGHHPNCPEVKKSAAAQHLGARQPHMQNRAHQAPDSTTQNVQHRQFGNNHVTAQQQQTPLFRNPQTPRVVSPTAQNLQTLPKAQGPLWPQHSQELQESNFTKSWFVPQEGKTNERFENEKNSLQNLISQMQQFQEHMDAKHAERIKRREQKQREREEANNVAEQIATQDEDNLEGRGKGTHPLGDSESSISSSSVASEYHALRDMHERCAQYLRVLEAAEQKYRHRFKDELLAQTSRPSMRKTKRSYSYPGTAVTKDKARTFDTSSQQDERTANATEFERLKSELKQLQIKLRAAESLLRQYERDLERSKAAQDTLQTANERLEQQQELAQADKTKDDQATAELRKTVEEQTRQIQELRNTETELNRKHAHQEGELDRIFAENKRLKEANATVWKDAEKWMRREQQKSIKQDEQVETLTHDIKRMSVELEAASEAQQELKLVKKQNAKLRERALRQGHASDDTRELHERTHREHEKKRKEQAVRFQAKIAVLEEENRRLQGALNDEETGQNMVISLKKENEDLRRSIVKATKDLTDVKILRQQNHKLEEELRTALENEKGTTQKNTRLKSRISELRSDIKKLAKHCDVEHTRANELSARSGYTTSLSSLSTRKSKQSTISSIR